MTTSTEARSGLLLPPFSGPMPNCRACGTADADAEYRQGIRCDHIGNESFTIHSDTTPADEWIHRTCRGCGYQWDEQVKNADIAEHPYTVALREELEMLWGDLNDALNHALSGCWSVRCESLEDRMGTLTRLVGPTPPGNVNAQLVLAGHYERMHRDWDVPIDPIDYDDIEAWWNRYLDTQLGDSTTEYALARRHMVTHWRRQRETLAKVAN